MERVVQVTRDGRVYTCRTDLRSPLSFWRVEVDGYPPYRTPLRVLGNEQPDFFRELAKLAAEHHGL